MEREGKGVVFTEGEYTCLWTELGRMFAEAMQGDAHREGRRIGKGLSQVGTGSFEVSRSVLLSEFREGSFLPLQSAKEGRNLHERRNFGA